MNKTIFNQQVIGPQDFNTLINKMRTFFMQKGYKEVYPQPLLSILAACEDPKTVRSFKFNGNIWPLPQTNQMHLERILMENADYVDGLFTITASYRDEPNPIEGRHMRSFSMFEAEHKGDFSHLLKTLSKLMIHLKLVKKESDILFFTYNELCDKYNTKILESEHEELLWKEYGDVIGIIYFPRRSNPFFNMGFAKIDEKTNEELYYKCDLIICGQETFGAAARSCNIEQMRESFYTISDGMYSKLLLDLFGEERVKDELENFFKLKMIERWGFGMGIDRLYRAMKLKNLI